MKRSGKRFITCVRMNDGIFAGSCVFMPVRYTNSGAGSPGSTPYQSYSMTFWITE